MVRVGVVVCSHQVCVAEGVSCWFRFLFVTNQAKQLSSFVWLGGVVRAKP